MDPLEPSRMLDHRKQVPNLVASHRYDPFSVRLRLVSYQVRRMNLRGVFDSTLIWSNEDASPLSLRTCPYLESLGVMFHVSSPSGSWYCDGLGMKRAPWKASMLLMPTTHPSPQQQMIGDGQKPDYIRWEGNVQATCRVVSNDDTLVPLLSSFASAARACMPMLKDAILYSPRTRTAQDISPSNEDYHREGFEGYPDFNHYDMAWGILYLAPGVKNGLDPPIGGVASRQLFWMVDDWRPDPELHHLFQHIGREQHGDGIVE
jgi:hypothetical protein